MNIHYMGFESDLRGWLSWPEREDLSTEFMRLLGVAQEGGAAIAECLFAASRINVSDDRSWYREWKRLADASYERGNAALCQGHVLTAKSNWLRAINYYQSAAFPFDRDDENRRRATDSCPVLIANSRPGNYPVFLHSIRAIKPIFCQAGSR